MTEPLRVTYRLDVPVDQVGDLAAALAIEQTIEFPPEAVDDPQVTTQAQGWVETVEAGPDGAPHATIAVPPDVVAGQLPQLLNVLWGNASLHPRVRLVGVTLPPAVLDCFPGPLFGVGGLRAATGVRGRPLLLTAVKPMGLPVQRLAHLAGRCAAAGVDLVKDDHGLADQPWAPFADRVGRLADAVARANARHGTCCVYAPSLNAPAGLLTERAVTARDAGAGALLVLPGLYGWPALQPLADVGLPLLAHPAGMGGWTRGVAAPVVFGTLARLAGADMSIFLVDGGRFPVPPEEADAVAAACHAPLDGIAPCLPCAGGGVTVANGERLRRRFGDDCALLVGGDLHRGADGLEARVAALRAALT